MPKEDYFAEASVQQNVKTLAEVTADGYTGGIDITAFEGEVMAVAMIQNTAGTGPKMDVTLQAAEEEDLIGVVTYAGTGDGTITEVEAGPDAVDEDITVTFSNATTAAVVGSVTGAMGNATVGTKFSNAQISFLLTAGETAFVNTDAFTVEVTGPHTYADVVAFAQVLGTTSIQRKVINSDQLGKYLRAKLDITGTDNPAFNVGVALFGLQN